MGSFLAIILVCASGTAPRLCTQDNAIDMRSVTVRSELGCTYGWQEIIARMGAQERVGEGMYLKTLCRRAER